MPKTGLTQIKRNFPENEAQKKEALKLVMQQIHKDFGTGSIMKLGEHTRMNVSAISTGSLTLDLALGIGGFPRGRIIEIFGPEASGKTTLALSCAAQAQKIGGIAAFIDAEHALDPLYAKKLGVDIDNLLISQPDYGEQALEITEKLVCSGAVDIVVVDSVAALVPKDELDGNMGDAKMALQARLMSQAMRKLSGVIAKSSCIVIFINQLRESMNPYAAHEVTTGGRALKFYASVRIDIRKGQRIMEDKAVIGNLTTCKVVKNKVAPPFKIAEFEMIFGHGISRMGEIVNIAANLGIIQKSGSWYSYEGVRIGQGTDKVKQHLTENPDVCAEIEAKVRAKSGDMKFERASDDEIAGLELENESGEFGLDITADDFKLE